MNQVVGLNRTQDASVCVLDQHGHAVAVQKERLTRQKHAWGAVGDLGVYVHSLEELRRPVEIVVECYSSDPEIHERGRYISELADTVHLARDAQVVEVSHHLAHLYSCYFPSGFHECAVMVVDCAGSHVSNVTETVEHPRLLAPESVETASYYYVVDGAVRCLKKDIWSGDWTRPSGLGAFYHLVTRRLFVGEGNEGKVMALASFGDASRLGLPRLQVSEGDVRIPDDWVHLLVSGESFLASPPDGPQFQRAADFAAAAQWCFEDALLRIAQWLQRITGSRNLCFAGGTALNCPGNSRVAQQSGFSHVYIPPAPHDGGTAIGCALYGLSQLYGAQACRAFSWSNDYLGIRRSPSDISAMAVQRSLRLSEPSDLPHAIADLLAHGAVVGLFQERSEFGPRALGSRSILADPRDPSIQRRINETVKGRELFRPLAPTVLAHAADQYFEWVPNSPYMQYTSPVRRERASTIPGVVHHDGTARLQVLLRAANPLFHRVIEAFDQITSVPMVLNTSFNGASEPIVETVVDAVDTFASSGIDVLVCPPYLVTK